MTVVALLVATQVMVVAKEEVVMAPAVVEADMVAAALA